MYGGTLNGNFGPLLDDLLVLAVDRVNAIVTVRPAREAEEGRSTADPGHRRGHTMTATSVRGGAACACVIGGWGHGELTMAPLLLSQTADGYVWSAPDVAGELPAGRAFHSATETGGACVLVYGGLGSGCCRTDVALLDLRSMVWSAPKLAGVPRCAGGRAGHGAAFFAFTDGRTGGENAF
jgi:hypothetical protein